MIGFLVFFIFGLWVIVSIKLCKFFYRRLYVGGVNKAKSVVILFFIFSAWFLTSAWYFGGAKIYYDIRLSKLCSRDGGVEIFTNVYLTSDRFNEDGDINFYKPTERENSLGDEYLYKRDVNFLFGTGEDDWLSAKRYVYKVFRKEDNELLARQVMYSRSGGDFFSFGITSSFFCPEIKSMSLFGDLFLSK